MSPAEAVAAAAPGRPVASSLEELLAGATATAMAKAAESLSGAAFDRVVVAGTPMVIKHLSAAGDWVQRAAADLTCRPVEVWRLGILDALPGCIDHAVAGCARWTGPDGLPAAALLMHDVADRLVADDLQVGLEQHRRFLDHMAALHARFWGWQDDHGLMSLHQRYMLLAPLQAEIEAERGGDAAVLRLVREGWPRLAAAAPRLHDAVRELVGDPWPLVAALEETPQTFIHGDFKYGNLGSHADGRTILLDWALPGRSPACADLAWYLCTNCDKLPETKEACIEAYRGFLEARGVDTAGWWERQLGLCLLGAFVQQGWSKYASRSELDWWGERVLDGLHLL